MWLEGAGLSGLFFFAQTKRNHEREKLKASFIVVQNPHTEIRRVGHPGESETTDSVEANTPGWRLIAVVLEFAFVA